ncbi:hypothetical protein [Stutzerimonas xanthomarina]|uniref:hypothetical protein n=1 Tax=Stutzerimonas xanthomarina TaxID=271420 RepID=UPI003AA8726E
MDCASSGVLQGRQVRPGRRRQGVDAGFADYLAGLSQRYLDHLHRRYGRIRLGRLKVLTDKIGDKVQLVGDDLFVTNTKILKRGTRRSQLDPDQVQPDRPLTETLKPFRWPRLLVIPR